MGNLFNNPTTWLTLATVLIVLQIVVVVTETIQYRNMDTETYEKYSNKCDTDVTLKEWRLMEDEEKFDLVFHCMEYGQ